jgi:PIN domain nuclease of toxin-antitoxin system
MKLLLDSHILIWAICAEENLSKHTQTALLDPNNEVFVSVVSIWEISLKFGLGKLQLGAATPGDISEFVENFGAKIIPIEADIAASYYELPITEHKDPFDRLLIWQAIKGGYTLVSSDQSFQLYEPFDLKLLVN